MGEATKIEWADNTFNPWWGCTRVSEACRHCYAETFDKRVHGIGNEHWGPTAPRRFFGDKRWAEPPKWNARAERTGIRERVFCASMADVFEDRDDLIKHRARLWELIKATPHLDWLLLTKRPENFWMLPWMEPDLDDSMNAAVRPVGRPWPNVWLGVTAETQADADRRIPILLDTPAVCRFVSVEPMLEAIDLMRRPAFAPPLWPKARGGDPWLNYLTGEGRRPSVISGILIETHARSIDWVICGGESGHGARPMHPDWARALRDQCVEAGTAFLFKQWGDWRERLGSEVVPMGPRSWGTLDSLGRFSEQRGRIGDPLPLIDVFRFGKKAAGRELDGRTWDEVPEVAA